MQTSNYIQKRRVLVVEDELCIQFIHKNFTLDLGFQVDTATCGKEALELYEPNKYHTVLIDISMPDIDGFTVYDTMQKKGETSTNFIFCTAHTSEDVIEQCKSRNCQYLLKPVMIEVLKKALEGEGDEQC